MNITVTIPLGKYGNSFITLEIINILESMGHVLWNHTDRQLSPEELRENLRDADVCISGWGCPQFDRYVLEGAVKLRLIAHTGGTIAPIVSDYLYDRGIRTISGNRLYAESVAEGTMAYMLSSLRDIPYYANDMKNGGWRTKGLFFEGLLEQTVGLVGFGMVAKYLVKMLAPFNVKVKVYDPYINEDTLNEYSVEKASLEDIFSTCKIISVHAPRTPETHHMISKRLFQMIKQSSIFINTARGDIIDEAALTEELQKNRFKAVLDVYEFEPLPHDSILRKLDNVILLPHMAGPTMDKWKCVTMALVDDVKSFFKCEELKYEIKREYAMSMTR